MEAMTHCSEIISTLTTTHLIGGIMFFAMAFCLGALFEKIQQEKANAVR
jgi:hypothetical protein